MSTVTEKDKEFVASAPPPLHSVLTILGLFVGFLQLLPSWHDIDEVATVECFTNRVFPDLISTSVLIVIRCACSILVFGTTLYSLVPANGWDQNTSYLPKSKLRQTAIPIRGLRVLLPYTSWCWNLLGVSFALSAYIAHQSLKGNQVPQYLLRAALIMYETAAPSTLLVSAVIRYAIWPNILRRGNSTKEISRLRTLIWHNANVVMALSETALWGGIPVKLGHVAVSPMYGFLYIVCAWSLQHFWRPDVGPQFIYFFLDTTLGKTTTYALLTLLAVLMTFYGIFAVAHIILEWMGGGVLTHLLFVVVLSSFVCRFRD